MSKASDFLARCQKTKSNYVKTQGLATSEPVVVTEELTGGHGLYVSVVPTSGSVKRLMERVLETFPLFEPNSSPHITVLYCRNVNKEKQFAQEIKDNCSSEYRKFPSNAVVTSIDIIDGHDDGNYLIVKLRSPLLDAFNARWREAGYEHSFPDYMAHMTLVDPAPFSKDEAQDWIDNFNNNIHDEPPILDFGDQILDDIKHGS